MLVRADRMWKGALILLTAVVMSSCEDGPYAARYPAATEPANEARLKLQEHPSKPSDTGFGMPSGPVEQ